VKPGYTAEVTIELTPDAGSRRERAADERAQTRPATAADLASLPAAFFERARQHAGSVALRRKKLGLWQEVSWADYEAGVRAVAAGLVELGVKPGEPVGLISENRVEWLLCDLGILSAGAVTCAMYTTSATEQVLYVMQHAAARILFAENEEQLDKALDLRRSHPIERIIVMEEKGLRRFSDPSVMLWDEFIAMGQAARTTHDTEVERRLAALKPDDLAILVYTSGTTGPPKGVMLSHRNLDWACRSIGDVAKPAPGDEVLSFLPLCHIAERTITVFNQVINGSIVNFAENLDTVRENLAEVRPHVFFAVPRIWEKLFNTIELKMRDASFAKRHLYAWAITVGRAVNEARQRALKEGRDPETAVSPGLRLAYLAADQSVLRPLREKLGFDRMRFAISGAAPISPEVISYFQAIGVPLVEGYGQTESTAIISVNPPGASPLGTVGLPVQGIEVKIADDGEILARSPGVMLGYYREAEATRATIDPDGWLHTGDVGEIDATGRLRITDRKKDLIITSGGKNIAPQYIESKLRTSAYIHDAVVIGERRKFVTALVILDEDNLVEWAQKSRVQFGAYAELARSPDVKQLIEQELESVNKTLTHVEAIKKFRVLERRLDREEGELTPTLKVRRKIVEDKYKPLIDEMYRG
jgi:long-chain acyl-CoA synthetase